MWVPVAARFWVVTYRYIQRPMINYEYLQYWVKTIEEINLHEKLLIENRFDYLRTREVEHLEYIINNANEIQRLDLLKREYYRKTFYEE